MIKQLIGVVMMGFVASSVSASERVPLPQLEAHDPRFGEIPQLNGIRAFANSPPALQGILSLGAAMHAMSIPRRTFELIVVKTVSQVGGRYEWFHHRARGLVCGLTPAQLDNIDHWRSLDSWTPAERAMLALVEESLARHGVSDSTFAEARQFFSARELVEVLSISAFYAAISQVTEALQVPLDDIDPATIAPSC